jgi:hypothetical protein
MTVVNDRTAGNIVEIFVICWIGRDPEGEPERFIAGITCLPPAGRTKLEVLGSKLKNKAMSWQECMAYE